MTHTSILMIGPWEYQVRTRVPRLMLLSGLVTDFVGVAAAGAVSIAFPLYKFSGSSLWAQTQQGHFS